jgi:nucleosome binding factor SPN SPT16 subunit
MENFFITEMSTIIDEERQVTNDKLSDLTENALEDPKMTKRIRFPPEVKPIIIRMMVNK